jgi:hypothetical protein
MSLLICLEPRAPSGGARKKRQKQVNGDHHKRAAKLDEKPGTAAASAGPFNKELNQYGQKGCVAGSVVGAFAEVSSDTYAMTRHLKCSYASSSSGAK